jgi:hypothetical protein
MMPQFVAQFCLFAVDETIDAYISFLDDAVDYLPLYCWSEVAQVMVRVPLLLGVINGDQNISTRATSLWNKMLGDLGELLLRLGDFAPLPEGGFDFDAEALEVALLEFFAQLENPPF